MTKIMKAESNRACSKLPRRIQFYVKKKILMSAAFVLAAVSSAFAQGNGVGGITEATNMVTSYFDPGV